MNGKTKSVILLDEVAWGNDDPRIGVEDDEDSMLGLDSVQNSNFKFVICDIDGTISDCEHRRHYLEGKKKDFKSFFAEQEEDKVIETTRTILDLFHDSGYNIIYCSARSEEHRLGTECWLTSNNLHHTEGCIGEENNLFMREFGDYRPDHIIKEEILWRKIKPYIEKRINYSWKENTKIVQMGWKKRISLVLDDRDEVVDMWRRNGLVCHQVAKGNF